MQIRHAYMGASIALAVEFFAAIAAAQPNFELHVDDARARLAEADRAFHEGRYRDAAAGYIAADRLQPTAATQLALAKTYDQLADASLALAAYCEYLERDPRAPDRAHVRARVDELSQRLAEQGVQQIHVSSEPTGANVAIDGKPMGTTPLYLDLPPGQHVVKFERQGWKPEQVEFELRLREPLNVMTNLAPAEAEPAVLAAAGAALPQPTVAAPEAAPEAQAPVEKADDSKALMTGLGLAALGGSVIALGVAVGFEVARANSEDRAEQEREQIAFKHELDAASSHQTTARAFAITAGVLAAAGGVLLVLGSQSTEVPSTPGGVTVACSTSECSALYRRQF